MPNGESCVWIVYAVWVHSECNLTQASSGIMALLPVYIQFLMQSDSVRTNETMIFEDEPGWKVLSLPSKTTDIYGENGRNWDGNDRTQTLVTLWNVNDLAGIQWKIRRNRQMKRRENVQEVVVSNANHDKTKHKPLHEIETAILHEIHTNRHTIGGFYKRWALTFDSVRLTESAICWRCLCEIIIATTKQIWRPSSSHMQQQSREWLETKEKIVSSNLCLRLNSLSVDYSAILWRRFPVSHTRDESINWNLQTSNYGIIYRAENSFRFSSISKLSKLTHCLDIQAVHMLVSIERQRYIDYIDRNAHTKRKVMRMASNEIT